jgi:hypothetical protein
MYKTGCIKDGGKRKILKEFPKETIELSEEQPYENVVSTLI